MPKIATDFILIFLFKYLIPLIVFEIPPNRDTKLFFGKEMPVYRLVKEHKRAWHAGVSSWLDEESLNDRSIGIEVVNEFACEYTHEADSEKSADLLECQFLAFPREQMDILKALLLDILDRYPRIDPVDVVAHSDLSLIHI